MIINTTRKISFTPPQDEVRLIFEFLILHDTLTQPNSNFLAFTVIQLYSYLTVKSLNTLGTTVTSRLLEIAAV